MQCDEETLGSGHANYAGGEGFTKGTIRLDGQNPRKVKQVELNEFTEPRVAILTCSKDVFGRDGCSYADRIGRDRGGAGPRGQEEGHSYTGVLHELMVYDRVLSQEEIEKLEKYLTKEWK